MAGNRNPFLSIPASNAPDEDMLETERYERIGRNARNRPKFKAIIDATNHTEGRQIPKAGSDNPFLSIPVNNEPNVPGPMTAEAQPPQAQGDRVDTFLGSMPRNIPELKMGTPENKEAIQEMISDAALSGSGMNIIGKEAKPLFGTIRNYFKKTEPYEKSAQEAQKAFEEAQLAEKSAKGVQPGQITQGAADSPMEHVENQLGRALSIEAPHGLRVSEKLKNRINSINKYWGDRYSNLMGTLTNSSFKMPEKVMEEFNKSDILKQIQKGGYEDVRAGKIAKSEPDSAFFTELMEKAPTSMDTNAADFMSKYKDFRNGLYELRQIAKTTRDEGLRRQLLKDVKKAEDMEKTVKETLEKGLGQHAPEFKEINKGYAEHVFPLRQNATARKVMKGGSLSDNMIKELNNNKEGSQLLKEIVKQDPEAVRHILGQQYAKSAKNLHSPNEMVREFLDELPEVKNLLKGKEDVLNEVAKKKTSSLEHKIKAESELEKIKGLKSAARKKVHTTAGIVGGGLGLSKANSILSALLSSK